MPEYAVLDKDTIKYKIIPSRSIAKRGYSSKNADFSNTNYAI